MFKSSIAAFAVATTLLVATPAAAAGVVLDQATIPETGHIDFGGTSSQLGPGGIAQTFTVGIDGVLDHVVLAVEHWTFLGAAADVRFQLQDAAFNTLVTRDVAAAAVPDSGFGGFDWPNALSLDLRAANIAVTAGQQLVLKVSSLGGYSGSVWRQGFSGQNISYAGGVAYSFDGPPGFPIPYALVSDTGFRTYVDTGTAAVPEPATWALTILGFATLGTSLRRRRAAVAA